MHVPGGKGAGHMGVRKGGTLIHLHGQQRFLIACVFREQILANNHNLDDLPRSWFTEVHYPADIPLRRRISSARPSSHTKPSPNTTSTNTSTTMRRPQSETALLRLRRAKSAFPSSSSSCSSAALPEEDLQDDSTLFCGGHQQRTETMRSRRELMELTGLSRKSALAAGANASRLKFLEAVRLERERLDVRVKLFLQSCDRVGEGGVSSKKQRKYQNVILPQTMYG